MRRSRRRGARERKPREHEEGDDRRALGFRLEQQFGPNMAMVSREDLTLWLAGPSASTARPTPDGRRPEPGGWNRFVIEVNDLAASPASAHWHEREAATRTAGQRSYDSRLADADCLIRYRSGSFQNISRSSDRFVAPP